MSQGLILVACTVAMVGEEVEGMDMRASVQGNGDHTSQAYCYPHSLAYS